MAGGASWRLALLLAVCVSAASEPDTPEADDVSDADDFVRLFEMGKQAYLDEYWERCIDAMQTAHLAFGHYRTAVVRCRTACKREADSAQPLSGRPTEDLDFFERQLRATLCQLKCAKRDKRLAKSYKKSDLQKFEQLETYDYMQLCYFQKNMLTKAADAAFTYLVANPNHTSMKKNLDYYLTLPEVDKNDITNLEAPKYVSLYIHGVDAYNKEDYPAVINNFEESLIDYLDSEEQCRAYCEGPFDQGWHPDFTPSIANHFTYCLKCKVNCTHNLNTLNGERHNDLLPSHYNYLQFAYFKVGKLKEACEAAVSYLLFFPADEEMLDNLKYYKSLPKAKPEFFNPREEVIQYLERFDYEWKILHFIEKEFNMKENKKGDEENLAGNPENDDQGS